MISDAAQCSYEFVRHIGPGSRPGKVPDILLDFIKHQAPHARYILSVCTGSWILAGTGVLDGRRATTNKAAFKNCKVCVPFIVVNLSDPILRQAATSDKIEWVAKARWVVDGNVWTSSGVTAGSYFRALSSRPSHRYAMQV